MSISGCYAIICVAPIVFNKIKGDRYCMQKTKFKCPKCRTQQELGKRLRASWTCPHCGNVIVPTREDKLRGYRPFKYNAMFQRY